MIFEELNYLTENFDYGTKPFDGKNPFDTSKVENTDIKQCLVDPDFMEERYNKRADIVMMSPTDYFNACAEIFQSTREKQIEQIKGNKKLDELKRVLLVDKKQLVMPYLDYTTNNQEGRHRMYLVGSMFGWDKKFPVAVVTWADTEKHEAELKKTKQRQVEDALIDAIDDAVDYVQTLNCYDVREWVDELDLALNRKFTRYPYNVNFDGKFVIIKVLSYEKKLHLNDLVTVV